MKKTTLEYRDFTSINELAKELKINKSKLAFYVSKKLLIPVSRVGRMYLFDKKLAVATIKKITEKQDSGLKLDDIATELITK